MALLRFLDGDISRLPEKAIITDDPMRVKMLVAHHLDNAVQITENRGMSAYTGMVVDSPVGIYSVGFGVSCTLLYLKEMVELGVRYVLYMGECVSHVSDISVNEIIIPQSAVLGGIKYYADPELVDRCLSAARQAGITTCTASVSTNEQYWLHEAIEKDNDEATDFASGAVFKYANTHRCTAASVLTVTENSQSGERMGDAQRQSRFYNAAKIIIGTVA